MAMDIGQGWVGIGVVSMAMDIGQAWVGIGIVSMNIGRAGLGLGGKQLSSGYLQVQNSRGDYT